ncbi:MAG: M15 family metallopeptidase [Candidatus Thiodiazotropha sp.]
MLFSDIVFSQYGLTVLVAVVNFHNFSLIICRALHIAWARSPIADILEVLAPPGCSEHHTGRAVDIGSGEVGPLEAEFELTPAFTWLHDHAHQFGFNLSFPQGNEFGYLYEPWHWCFSERRPNR